MYLLDLPLEIFQQILQDAIDTSSIVPLSLVNRVFEREIFSLLQKGGFLTTSDLCSVKEWEWGEDEVEFLAKYVTLRPYTRGTHPMANFPAILNSVVDKIMEDHCHCGDYEKARTSHLRILCYRALKQGCLDHHVPSKYPVAHHAFIAAIYLRKFSFVHALLENEETWVPTIQSELWIRPLYVAIQMESISLIRLLLLYGARPEHYIPKAASTCLELAIHASNAEDILSILFDRRWHCQYESRTLESAVYLAVQLKKSDVAMIILDVIYELRRNGPFITDYLCLGSEEASKQGMLQVLINILDLRESACGVHMSDYTKLALIACQHGHSDIVLAMLKRGAAFHTTTFEHLPLTLAAKGGNVETVRLILRPRQTLGAVQATKLLREIAPLPQSAEVAWYLLQKGAIKIEELDASFKITGIHIAHIMTAAAQYGNVEFVEALARYGVPIDDDAFYTEQECPLPIIAATAFKQADVIRALLDLGAKMRDPLDSIIARHFRSGKYPCHPPILEDQCVP